jgi:hypothetical protein
LTALRNLFGRGGRVPGPAPFADAGLAELVAEGPAGGAAPRSRPGECWPPVRLGLAEQLWGEGFLSPGGGAEVLRLAVPMGLSEATSLLLLGAAAGGPPRVLAAELGVWVSAYESDPSLAALAGQRIKRAGAAVAKHATVEPWDPAAPQFHANAFHHAIAFDALHDAPPTVVLGALREAIKPGGQLVLQEMVADAPLDPSDVAIAAWSRLERRSPDLPSEAGVTAELQRLHFDVRVAEDQSGRHAGLAVQGWQGLVQSLRGAHPSHLFAEALVNEAELWARRISLIQGGRIRFVRWHAYAESAGRSRPRA